MKIAEIAVIGASIAWALGVADRALAISPSGPRAEVAQPWPIEPAQYAWGGRPFCWYDEGWHGPGWYRCGNPWRRGDGWGGGYGWRREPYDDPRDWGEHEHWGRGEWHGRGRGDREDD